MYCHNCGKEIDDKAVICIHCGCQINKVVKEEKKNDGCLGCFLLLIFIPIALFVINDFNKFLNEKPKPNSSTLYKIVSYIEKK